MTTKVSPKYYIVLLLAALFALSLLIRTVYPFNQVFVGDWIKFTSIDAYYHMRVVDNLVHNFPFAFSFDPYFIFPGGEQIVVRFFDWFLAGIIWVVGLGSPTQHTIDVIGVLYPAILAALTVIPVYFIGKTLFNRWAGVFAAGLIAVLPGEFLGRSMLGFADHEVAAALFSATAILFLILAIKTARQRELTFNHIWRRDWSVITRPLVYALLGGFFLGICHLTWGGTPLFSFLIAVYFIIQFVINHIRNVRSDYLCITGGVVFLVTLIMFIPLWEEILVTTALVVAMILPFVLWGVARLMSRWGIRPAYYPLALVGLGVVVIGLLYLVSPDFFRRMFGLFSIFAPAGPSATTTDEMRPFLFPYGSFSTSRAWGNFGTGMFLLPSDWADKNLWWFPGFAIIPIIFLIWLIKKHSSEKENRTRLRVWMVVTGIVALVLWFAFPADWKILFPGFATISFLILLYLFIRKPGDKEHWLIFLIWNVIILAATLGQRRFAYYFAINIALLMGHFAWLVVWYAGIRKLSARAEKTPEEPVPSGKARVKERRHKTRGVTIYVNTILAIIVIFFILFYPNITAAKIVASNPQFAPTDAWQASLLWMKDNTPEPFGDKDAYYAPYQTPPAGEEFQYPASAYSVLSWWDFGYWISRTAHRPPNANPSQAPAPIKKVAAFFLSPDESSAKEVMAELGSSYVIADFDIATMRLVYYTDGSISVPGKYYAILEWAGQERSDFYDYYYVVYKDVLLPKIFYYPEYYSSMLVRLYNFDGKAVADETPLVVTFEEKTTQGGSRYRQVTDIKEFSSYKEALGYVEAQGTSNCRIVSGNPFVSPIPLEALESYRLVYSSEYSKEYRELVIGTELQAVTVTVPEVKIFEYTGD
jgi:oligosaccharyl transferase (archaeosortase A-associated)